MNKRERIIKEKLEYFLSNQNDWEFQKKAILFMQELITEMMMLNNMSTTLSDCLGYITEAHQSSFSRKDEQVLLGTLDFVEKCYAESQFFDRN